MSRFTTNNKRYTFYYPDIRPEVRITIILKPARTVTICNIFSTGSSLNKIKISDMWRRIYSFEILNTVPGFVRKN